ncbi:MAG: sugar transferase, partial [Prolixibacteraceae bacterium]|nr:sugar transferase [Prolixibacteraceae bacterium]
MNKKRQVARYLFFDFLAAALSWTLFYIYRKQVIEPVKFGYKIPIEFNSMYYLGLLLIPVCWLLFYFITGFYQNIYRRSRLIELWQTVLTSVVGVTALFFALMLDDTIYSYKNYYNLYFTLLGLQFFFTYFVRLILTAQTTRRIHTRKIGFNTLIIGNNEKAFTVFKEMSTQPRPQGNIFTGYIHTGGNEKDHLASHLASLGTLDSIESVIAANNIEEVIIALEPNQHELMNNILTSIENQELIIWGIPDLYDFLSGTVKVKAIYSSPLIKISNGLMPAWQANMKRLIDISFSSLAIILLSPFYLVLPIIIKSTSKGPVIYKQERIGRFGKPF